MWKSRLRKQYRNLEEFKQWCELFNNHVRLGYQTPEEAWEDNPVIQGSTDPKDYRNITRAELGGN